MKAMIYFVLMCTLIFSQEYTSAKHVDEIKKLSAFIGKWEGESWYKGRNGKQTSTVKEHVQLKLDGTAILVEGVGYHGERMVHNAMAVITYNTKSNKFDFKSFLSNGRGTNATLELTKENTYEWYFSTPTGMKFRYEIEIKGNQWLEKGFMARDGKNFVNFMGMTLNRVKE